MLSVKQCYFSCSLFFYESNFLREAMEGVVVVVIWIIFFLIVFFSVFNILWFIIAFIAYLAECSRVPFDLSEAESEIVAGFTTEYSSIYFSILILTEYINVIVGSVLLIILFAIPMFFINSFLYFICIFRCTFVRLKFDELLILAWNTFLIISFGIIIQQVALGLGRCSERFRTEQRATNQRFWCLLAWIFLFLFVIFLIILIKLTFYWLLALVIVVLAILCLICLIASISNCLNVDLIDLSDSLFF